ncbi:MAG: YidC/Oxa1 family membrane protein insertase [Candidatus Pacebacteria bacterium]|nr:YidC/Oxa1 family membrane protein insertase [Candidatus Paceibacterota bacterium]
MLSFLHTILYVPIYNLLIFLVDLTHSSDVGLGLIGVTLIVRLIIMPLSLSAVRTSRAMKVVEPELKEIREKFKDDKEAQAKETFALYKKYKIRPFASILTIFIQLPILISLYLVVRTESLYHVNTSLLYSFIHAPAMLSPLFLGLFLITTPNLILAVIAAATQMVQAYYAIPLPPAPDKSKKKGGSPTTPESMQEEFGRAMALQARFVLPIVIGIIAYSSGAIALYFITSNSVMLLQELLARLFPHSANNQISAKTA